VVRRFVTFAGGDGTPIPGYLFEPQGRGRRPAVLVLSGHGHGIVETAGLVPSYQNSVALRLARAGYVAFTPELRGFGYLGPRAGFEHSFVAYNAFLAGSFYKAVLARDLARAVDLLQTLPSVDPARLAVTGCRTGERWP
jgi:dienelactone hydrolase